MSKEILAHPSLLLVTVIYDLLEPTGQNLCVREDAQGTYVEGKKEEVVLSPAHALSFIAAGEGLEKKNAAKRLWTVTKLINQVVGDALSGLLLVEAILQHMGWSVDKCYELYHDLPSRQLKVRFGNKNDLCCHCILYAANARLNAANSNRVMDIQEKDKNRSQNDKTEHENGKTVRSQKDKSQIQQKVKVKSQPRDEALERASKTEPENLNC
ncbi:phosphoacetylglucosamine mutase [Tanacetum coccineum]